MFLICHVTSLKYMFKGLFELMGESFSRSVPTLSCSVTNCVLQIMCIVIVYYPVFDVISFEFGLDFLSSRFPKRPNI